MPTYSTILVDRTDGITTIRLNRPDKKNAMSPTLHREMYAALSELELDAETRIVIVTGVGDSFCAGEDLKEYFYDFKDKPQEAEHIKKIARDWRGRMLRGLSKPTIASVNGWCFGGAFAIVANCDLAIAAEDAVFGLSEINFGLFPGGLVPRAIIDTLRWRDVMYYSLTGEQFDGKRAAEMGFVNYAVPRARLPEETLKLAGRLAEKHPLALKETKEVLHVGRRMTDEDTWYWAQAKGNELTHLQKGEWLEKGVRQFKEGKYRPGFGAYEKD